MYFKIGILAKALESTISSKSILVTVQGKEAPHATTQKSIFQLIQNGIINL